MVRSVTTAFRGRDNRPRYTQKKVVAQWVGSDEKWDPGVHREAPVPTDLIIGVTPVPFVAPDPTSPQVEASIHMLPTSTDRLAAAPSPVAPEGEVAEDRVLVPDPRADAANTKLDGVIGLRLKAFAKEWSDADEWTRRMVCTSRWRGDPLGR